MKSLVLRIVLCFFMTFSVSFFYPVEISGQPAADMLVEAPPLCASDPLMVDLDYRDAELSNVLRSMARSYGLNIVAARDVTGRITVSLSNVTVDEALDAILSINGYAYTRRGEIIFVTRGSGLENVGIHTAVFQMEHLQASDVIKLLDNIPSPGGSIRVNDATNSIVVTDHASFISKVEEAITLIDTPPAQVLIEARLVDISEKDLENFGVTYSVDYEPAGLVKGLFNRSTLHPERVAGGQSLAGPSTTLSGGQLKITALSLKGLSGSMTIDALIRNSSARLLASPSILTLNGKEARIIIGERYPYKEKTQTTTGTTETTKFVDIGTTLRVIPWVFPNGTISMYVHPEVSSFSQALDAGPRVATREADATIRVRDGQTIVIGGLIKRTDEKVRGGIPFLKDIPLLGAAFSQRSGDSESTELVVFITPRIIRDQEIPVVDDGSDREVFLQVDEGSEQVLVKTLWEEAQNYENNRGVESMGKDEDWRMVAAMNNYRKILSLYPDNRKADDALYRKGRLYRLFFKDNEAAMDCFEKLIEEYPGSRHVRSARSFMRRIERETRIRRGR